jgi:hypothetical protein
MKKEPKESGVRPFSFGSQSRSLCRQLGFDAYGAHGKLRSPMHSTCLYTTSTRQTRLRRREVRRGGSAAAAAAADGRQFAVGVAAAIGRLLDAPHWRFTCRSGCGCGRRRRRVDEGAHSDCARRRARTPPKSSTVRVDADPPAMADAAFCRTAQ